MSTEANDMDSSNDIGAMEGWNKDIDTNKLIPIHLIPYIRIANFTMVCTQIVK